MSVINCEKCGKPQKVVVTSAPDLIHEDVSYAKKKICQNCYNKIMVEKQAQVEAIVEEGKTTAEAVTIVRQGKPLAEAIAIIKEEKTLAEPEAEAEPKTVIKK